MRTFGIKYADAGISDGVENFGKKSGRYVKHIYITEWDLLVSVEMGSSALSDGGDIRRKCLTNADPTRYFWVIRRISTLATAERHSIGYL